MATKRNRPPRGGLVLLAFLIVMLVGGIYSAAHGGTAQPSTTDDFSTVLPSYTPDTYTYTYTPYTTDTTDTKIVAPTTEVPQVPVDTGGVTGGGGGDLDLPGQPYIDGPDIHCHLSGCHIHLFPHIGHHR